MATSQNTQLSKESRSCIPIELSPEEMNRRSNPHAKKTKSLDERNPKPRKLAKRSCLKVTDRLDVCAYIKQTRIYVEQDQQRGRILSGFTWQFDENIGKWFRPPTLQEVAQVYGINTSSVGRYWSMREELSKTKSSARQVRTVSRREYFPSLEAKLYEVYLIRLSAEKTITSR
jgi:hypothetical protein